jgi:hypothetical protein
MAAPERFKTKDDLITTVLRYYRAHAHELSGPTEATTTVWPQIRRLVPAALLQALAQEQIVQEVGRRATCGTSLGERGDAASGLVTLRHLGGADGPTPGTPVTVEMQQLPSAAPGVLYPRILVDTVYATLTMAKPLLLFTVADFDYVMEGFVEQRDGLERHIEAMRAGAALLRRHKVKTVHELPAASLQAFAQTWHDAVRPPKQKVPAA